jgi:hypothetical protein
MCAFTVALDVSLMKTHVAWIMALLATIVSAPHVTLAQSSQPNILLILTDDTGWGTGALTAAARCVARRLRASINWPAKAWAC